MGNIFKIAIDKNRVFGLDILRALAILFVVAAHGNLLIPGKIRSIINFFLFDGVSIFFVLSGYLIGGILIKIIESKTINTRALLSFWKRRWFRTLPNYFLILLVVFLLNYFFNSAFKPIEALSYFFFTQNVYYPHPEFFPEAWSLSVEEWFYLIVPLFIFSAIYLIRVDKKRAILLTSILLICGVLLFRLHRYLEAPILDPDDWALAFRMQVITRLDSLMFGVVGAFWATYHKFDWIKYRFYFFWLGLCFLLFSKYLIPYVSTYTGLYSSVFSFSVISMATLLLLPLLSQIKVGVSLFYLPITYISLISYSMYLINYSIIQVWVIKKIPWHSLFVNEYLVLFTKYASYWTLVICFSIILYKYFEVPMMRLRDRGKFS